MPLAFELGGACQFDWSDEGLVVGARRPIVGLFESSTYDAWSDVTAAERYWAELLRYRLCMRRGASNCVKPAQ